MTKQKNFQRSKDISLLKIIDKLITFYDTIPKARDTIIKTSSISTSAILWYYD